MKIEEDKDRKDPALDNSFFERKKEIEAWIEHIRYATWEAAAFRFGTTDQLKIRKEYLDWREGE